MQSDKYKWCLEELSKYPLQSNPSLCPQQDQLHTEIYKNTSKSIKTYMQCVFGAYCGLALCTFIFKTFSNVQKTISGKLSPHDNMTMISQIVAPSSNSNQLKFQSIPITCDTHIGHRVVDSLAFPKSLGEYIVAVIGNLVYKSKIKTF